MDSRQQRKDLLPGDTIPAVEALWNATAFLAPQHPQEAPSSCPLPVSGQPHGHVGVVRDAMVSDWYPDVHPFTRTHMSVLFLVHSSWQSSGSPGLGGYIPTSRKQCCSRSITGPAER